jgi:hypothetical protein
MGKLVTIFGDMGFIYLNEKNANALNSLEGWVIFPSNQFSSIKSFFKEDVTWTEGFYWYLGESQWSSPAYKNIGCSYERTVRMHPFFKNEKSFKELYEKSVIKFKNREIELWEEIINAINSNPKLLEQEWNNQESSNFAEFNEIINIAKLNDSKFEVKFTNLNNSTDVSIDFFHEEKSKVGKFFKGFDNLINRKGVKPKFSFRLSEILKISTVDGQVFRIQTKVGDYRFPWLYKLHASHIAFGPNEYNW